MIIYSIKQNYKFENNVANYGKLDILIRTPLLLKNLLKILQLSTASIFKCKKIFTDSPTIKAVFSLSHITVEVER